MPLKYSLLSPNLSKRYATSCSVMNCKSSPYKQLDRYPYMSGVEACCEGLGNTSIPESSHWEETWRRVECGGEQRTVAAIVRNMIVVSYSDLISLFRVLLKKNTQITSSFLKWRNFFAKYKYYFTYYWPRNTCDEKASVEFKDAIIWLRRRRISCFFVVFLRYLCLPFFGVLRFDKIPHFIV